jgi:hypothetical protein
MSAMILAGIFLFSCHSKKALSPEDSIRALKVLNSDMTNITAAAKEQPAFMGLDFLFRQPSSPLSFLHGFPGRLVEDSLHNIESWNGKYVWNKDSLAFISNKPAEEINIIFPLDKSTENNAQFVFSKFECQPSLKISCFPAGFAALMESQGAEILKIKYKAEFEDEWPVNIQCEFNGEGLSGYIRMDRTRKEDNGTITVRFTFNANGFTIMEGSIKTEIGYNGSLIYAKVVEPDLTIFDVNITGHLDYGKVNPTSQDYIQSFNDNCHIIFRESGSGNKIGDFGLGKDETGELVEWVIYLSDGSIASFYDYLLVFKKLMDYKYPNKRQAS